MKQIFLLLAGVCAFIIIIGVLHKYPLETQNALQNPASWSKKTIETSLGDKITIKIGEVELLVELADTNEKRSKGLSGKKGLGDNEGMLFIFDRKNVKPSFWMKGMLFSIDIIWIKDGKVAQIEPMVLPPEPGTPDRSIPLLIPENPFDYVLETEAGFSEKNQINAGTSVDLSNLEEQTPQAP